MRRSTLVLAAGGVIAATWSAPAAAPVVPVLCDLFDIRRRLYGPGIALTFDDGPRPQGTPAVLEELARHGVPATFFLVGEQVVRNPSLAAEIVAAGHEVALHGHAHTLLLRRTPRSLERDLDRALGVIEGATGVTPACYRPPYGVFSAAGLASPTAWLDAGAVVEVGTGLGCTADARGDRATSGRLPRGQDIAAPP